MACGVVLKRQKKKKKKVREDSKPVPAIWCPLGSGECLNSEDLSPDILKILVGDGNFTKFHQNFPSLTVCSNMENSS